MANAATAKTPKPENPAKTSKVDPVPKGTHTVSPHLVVAGAAKAIEFYKAAFGAVELMRMPGTNGKLIHACIKIGDSNVMLVDEFPAWKSLGPNALNGTPVTLHLAVDDADAWAARAVAAGAKLTMPVQDMFWGDRYGVVEDPFGHKWAVATHIKDLTPEEIIAAMPKDMGS
jgi:PhnB protein